MTTTPRNDAVYFPRQSWRLTAREYELAELIAQGLTNKQIAQRMVISVRTADNHLQHIFDKLGVSSRAQVAAWVVLDSMRAQLSRTDTAA